MSVMFVVGAVLLGLPIGIAAVVAVVHPDDARLFGQSLHENTEREV